MHSLDSQIRALNGRGFTSAVTTTRVAPFGTKYTFVNTRGITVALTVPNELLVGVLERLSTSMSVYLRGDGTLYGVIVDKAGPQPHHVVVRKSFESLESIDAHVKSLTRKSEYASYRSIHNDPTSLLKVA